MVDIYLKLFYTIKVIHVPSFSLSRSPVFLCMIETSLEVKLPTFGKMQQVSPMMEASLEVKLLTFGKMQRVSPMMEASLGIKLPTFGKMQQASPMMEASLEVKLPTFGKMKQVSPVSQQREKERDSQGVSKVQEKKNREKKPKYVKCESNHKTLFFFLMEPYRPRATQNAAQKAAHVLLCISPQCPCWFHIGPMFCQSGSFGKLK